MNLRELLLWGQKTLEQEGIQDASTDAWYCLEHISGISRACYYARQDAIIEDSKEKEYRKLIEKRAAHIPLQQLLGEAWFCGNVFYVNEHVLIPRQDTEVLVEEARKHLSPGKTVLDLCTGSGCVLLALMKACPDIRGTGADISPEALEVAKKNGERLGIQAQWIESNLFEGVEGTFHLITSNPPYIASSEIPTLMEEVREHEPWAALDGGADGLDFYRKIAAQAGGRLRDSGWLCLEIGYDQGSAVSELLREAGYENIEIIRDLAGLDRVVVGQKSQGGNHV